MGKEFASNAGGTGSIPGSRRSPREEMVQFSSVQSLSRV